MTPISTVGVNSASIFVSINDCGCANPSTCGCASSVTLDIKSYMWFATLNQIGNDFCLNNGTQGFNTFFWIGQQPYAPIAWTRAQLTNGVVGSLMVPPNIPVANLSLRLTGSHLDVQLLPNAPIATIFGLLPYSGVEADVGNFIGGGQVRIGLAAANTDQGQDNAFLPFYDAVATPPPIYHLVDGAVILLGIDVDLNLAGSLVSLKLHVRLSGDVIVKIYGQSPSAPFLWMGGDAPNLVLFTQDQVSNGVYIAILQYGPQGPSQVGTLLLTTEAVANQLPKLLIWTPPFINAPTAGVALPDGYQALFA